MMVVCCVKMLYVVGVQIIINSGLQVSIVYYVFVTRNYVNLIALPLWQLLSPKTKNK